MQAIESFDVPYENTVLKGDFLESTSASHILLLHGAGVSSRATAMRSGLRPALQQRGVATTSFDCIGHGDTGGALLDSSLSSRTRQAEAVIAARKLAEPLVICGTSMGAYNAIRLTQKYQVTGLILIVPGVYTPAAYGLPFGPQFSEVIRRDRSWADSDAWSILRKFKGDLLVIAAEHDAVIPLEIPDRLLLSAQQARSRRLRVVAGTDHSHLFPLVAAERPAEFDALMTMMVDCGR
ncbi:hydrolase of the alpha/beta superfamily [Collimonas arenae]|uniref:Hydrolase of the alpha/beta superfamily n=1 Tax=Collimonas arenae TaxID=279058 RepID=A0A0A1F3T1_9BURK|nr:alpha/beta hydrolase [Collimonas arenae]AIY39201.1 hydrolase of the alpha/beta superfamily [Collimonas arenae]